MSAKPSTVGVVCATFTAVVWGGQFGVGKSALCAGRFILADDHAVRGAAVLMLVLLAVCRIGALLPQGRLRQLALLGTLGFAGFNLLAYTGLEHARPESASLIVALAPLLTALVLWVRERPRV
jgi:drug/metabolite transporter (DMT)-like permease